MRHGVRAPDQPLNSLQAGRGIAAVMVVLLHAGVTVSVPKYWNVELFGGLFRAGSAGVEFFFVLSGFIIFWVHRRDIGVPSAFPRYAWRRAVRIYPIYWVVLTLMVAAKLAMPSFLADVDTTAAGYITSYALVGPHHAPILGVAWTLFHEMLFYALFTTAILWGRAGLAILGLWFVASAMSLPFDYLTVPINLLFGFGIIAAVILQRGDVPAPRLLLLAASAGFIAVALLKSAKMVDDYVANLLFGPLASAAIVGAVTAERNGRLRTPGALVLLGNASYSIYLIHVPTLSIGAKIFDFLPALAGYATLVAMSIVAGIGLHLVVEKPILHRLRNRFRAKAAA